MRRSVGLSGRLWLAAAVVLSVALAACEKHEESQEEDQQAVLRAGTAKPNPASLNCKYAQGTSLLVKRGDGGQYGICRFESGRACEEWAMFLGFCPTGGIDVSAYTQPAVRYCVLRGGKYVGGGDPNTPDHAARCALPGNVDCSVDELYAGHCKAALH
jgi:putative hemolysin